MTINKSGKIVDFLSAEKVNIRSLKVYFSPKQSGSGIPSPENVRPISGWDGVNVYGVGRNIWDEQWENGIFNTATGTNGTSNSNQIRCKNYIPVSPNT